MLAPHLPPVTIFGWVGYGLILLFFFFRGEIFTHAYHAVPVHIFQLWSARERSHDQRSVEFNTLEATALLRPLDNEGGTHFLGTGSRETNLAW